MATVMHIFLFHPGHRSEREAERGERERERVVLAAAAFNVSGSSAPRAAEDDSTVLGRRGSVARRRGGPSASTGFSWKSLGKSRFVASKGIHNAARCSLSLNLTVNVVHTIQSRESLVGERARCRAPREYFERAPPRRRRTMKLGEQRARRKRPVTAAAGSGRALLPRKGAFPLGRISGPFKDALCHNPPPIWLRNRMCD